MAEINPVRNSRVPPEVFDKFKKDLEFLLEVFQPELLAKWMDYDAGNFNKKIHGTGNQKINSNFLRDFYGRLSSVIAKRQKGIAPYQIEREMETGEVEEPPAQKNIWEELRLVKEELKEVKEELQECKTAIRELQEKSNQ